MRAALLAGVLLASAAVFLALLQEVMAGGTLAIDEAILAWAEAHRTPTLTRIAVDVTALGSRTVLTVAATLVVSLLWTNGRRLAAVDTALACTTASLVTHTTKSLLGRPRPPLTDHLVQVMGFSFPSGHASGITALLTATALHTIEAAPTRTQRIVLGVFHALLILGVACSRVYLGVHYPSDILAGLCLGIACAVASHGLVRTRVILRELQTWLR